MKRVWGFVVTWGRNVPAVTGDSGAQLRGADRAQTQTLATAGLPGGAATSAAAPYPASCQHPSPSHYTEPGGCLLLEGRKQTAATGERGREGERRRERGERGKEAGRVGGRELMRERGRGRWREDDILNTKNVANQTSAAILRSGMTY